MSIIAKYSCSGSVKSGTRIATLPNPFDLGDGFIMGLINSGDKMGYLRLTHGNLEYIGANGGGDMTGNCWIPPQAWTAIMGL